MKYFTLLFIPIFSFLTFDYFLVRSTEEVVHDLTFIERENQNTLLEIFGSYQERTAIFHAIKGISIYSSGNSLIDSEGESVAKVLLPSDGEKNIKKIGMFKYQAAFYVTGRTEKSIVNIIFIYTEYVFLFVIFSISILLPFVLLILISSKKQQELGAEVLESGITRAHELKAILDKAHHLTEFLAERNLEKADEYASIFNRGYEYHYRLIDDLLTLRGCSIKDPIDIDLPSLVEASFGTIISDYSRFTVTKSFLHTKTIIGDASKIFSIISNLIRNAVRHSDGLVIVRTHDTEKGVSFEVSNSGKQIPKKFVKKIFNPYVSGSRSTGIGLSIVKRYVDLHNGSITVESTSKLTTFIVFFPASVEAVGKKTNKKVVAIVDDEPCTLDRVRSSNYAFILFTHPDALISSLLEGKNGFAAVVCDRFGPGFDSVADEFPKYARKAGYPGPIFLYTSATLADSEKTGFSFCFSKKIFLISMR